MSPDGARGSVSYYFSSTSDVFAELPAWLTERIYVRERGAVVRHERADAQLASYVDAVFLGPTENRKLSTAI